MLSPWDCNCSEYSGLISFIIETFNLLAVQGTLKSLLQHHSSKASILQHSAFFMVHLSHPYMISKVISLLLNMLSRLVITFLPRSKRLLISWLQSPSRVILEPKKIKSATVPTFSPSVCHKMIGLEKGLVMSFNGYMGGLNARTDQDLQGWRSQEC